MTKPQYSSIKNLLSYFNNHHLAETTTNIRNHLYSQLVESGNNNAFGVVYVAFGFRYLSMALYSAKTIRKKSNVNISILTNVNEIDTNIVINSYPVNSIYIINISSDYKRLFKLSVDLWSPYKKTIFLDTDMIIHDQIEKTKYYLDEASIALSLRPYGLTNSQTKIPLGLTEGENRNKHRISMGAISFNSGLFMLEKSNQSNIFFSNWRNMYKKQLIKYNFTGDQPSLYAAYSISNCKIDFIPFQWNYRDGYTNISKYSIYHYHPRKLSPNINRKIFLFTKLIYTSKIVTSDHKYSKPIVLHFIKYTLSLLESVFLPIRQTKLYRYIFLK